jgi:RNA polymerase sigma-70 factor (ECF subfamily)
VSYAVTYVTRQEIAEDIVQELFIRIWENRNSIKITRSLKAYLFTSTRNSSINYLRSKYAKVPFDELTNIKENQIRTTSEDRISENELKRLIHSAVENLPEKCRIIFNLSRNSDLSHQEIADQLNISKKTVYVQIRNAVIRIKEILDEKWE